MKCVDFYYLNYIVTHWEDVKNYFENLVPNGVVNKNPKSFPLDSEAGDIIKKMRTTLEASTTDYDIFLNIEDVKTLWLLLIQKSIECLRYYDKREPFEENEAKRPLAYGLNSIEEYYKKYIAFEKVLYGGAKYYRDHVVHVFRVWLIGLYLLIKDDFTYLERIQVNYKDEIANPYEKLSIWTLISLTHDLGYPLEKASQIINTTRDMMSAFVASPQVSVDFAFHGVQNTMNDFVLRFISSKMIDSPDSMKRNAADGGGEERKYVARLQPKYYFKLQKSLEHNKHGILSAIIVYKLLLFFLESDYNVNEDYLFTDEESRQFYIRREILRAVAAHTCSDIYQMNQLSFAFLLIMCDDAQEWGRKDIGMLYSKGNYDYEYEGLSLDVEQAKWVLSEKYKLKFDSDIVSTINRFYLQCCTYLDIFRDGQDTKHRDFDFERKVIVTAKEINYKLILSAIKDQPIKVELTCEGRDTIPEQAFFVKEFKKKFTDSNVEGNVLRSDMRIKVRTNE